MKLEDHLRSNLEKILQGFPRQQRVQWYETYLKQILEEKILSHASVRAKFKQLQKLDDFVKDTAGRKLTLRRNVPEETIRRFLHPDETLAERFDETPISFLGFLKEHAAAAWFDHKHGGWLSSEENYRTARQYWAEGRFVGMTADLTDHKAMDVLSRWLKDGGKEAVSAIYDSNVAAWVGAEKAEQMYRQFGRLPLREDSLILQSNNYLALQIRPIRHNMLMLFYEYVSPGLPAQQKHLLFREMIANVVSVPDGRVKFYRRLSDSAWGYFQWTGKRDSQEAQREAEIYRLLTTEVRNSEAKIRDLDPNGFEKWVREWAKRNNRNLPTETPQFRTFLWNLVDAGIIRSWPDDFWRKHNIPPPRTAGLEEARSFSSSEEFLSVYGALLQKQGLFETAQALAEQSNHVTAVLNPAAPESPTAVIAYTHPEWEMPVDAQLKRGSIPSVFFVVSSYPANGLLYPPAVVVQQDDVLLPAEPNPAVPIIALRSLAAVGNLTPGLVYAVAMNKSLAGQVIGPIIGILTFTDEQGRTIHAVFA